MKPSASKNCLDGFTRGTVTCLLSNIGFTRGTDRFHQRDRQSHQRDRVLNFDEGDGSRIVLRAIVLPGNYNSGATP